MTDACHAANNHTVAVFPKPEITASRPVARQLLAWPAAMGCQIRIRAYRTARFDMEMTEKVRNSV